MDVLDLVPADAQVASHVLDGHVLRQFQGVAFEGMRVANAWVGKGEFDLAGDMTMLAFEAWKNR